LACSAALAVLDVMEQENLVENARIVGDYLMEKLKGLNHPKIKDVRGRGLMIGIELTEDQKPVRQRLVYEQHVFTGCSGQNLLRLLPPLTFTKEMADEFVERLQKVL
jgi:acetylornithine aminotransferase